MPNPNALPAPQGVTPACRCGCHRYGTTIACADCPDRHAPALDLAKRLEEWSDEFDADHRHEGAAFGLLREAAARLRDQSATIEASKRVVEVLRNIVASYDFGQTTWRAPHIPYLYEHMYEAKKALAALASPTDQPEEGAK